MKLDVPVSVYRQYYTRAPCKCGFSYREGQSLWSVSPCFFDITLRGFCFKALSPEGDAILTRIGAYAEQAFYSVNRDIPSEMIITLKSENEIPAFVALLKHISNTIWTEVQLYVHMHELCPVAQDAASYQVQRSSLQELHELSQRLQSGKAEIMHNG